VRWWIETPKVDAAGVPLLMEFGAPYFLTVQKTSANKILACFAILNLFIELKSINSRLFSDF